MISCVLRLCGSAWDAVAVAVEVAVAVAGGSPVRRVASAVLARARARARARPSGVSSRSAPTRRTPCIRRTPRPP